MRKSGVLAVVLFLEVFNNVEIESHTGCSIHYLSHQCSVKSTIELLCEGYLPCVESFDSTFCLNLPGNREWAGGATGLAAELDADLDHVHRLDLT